jgi:hypothetical protein
MAGLGAYGGAGLGGGLSELGAGELAQRGISESMPSLAEGATQAQIDAYTQQVNNLRTAGLESASKLPMADKLSAGFSSATASPMDAFNFAKDNKLALGMAAAPIMADMMVPTTTKSAPVQSPGRIVEKRWDGRQFVPVASTDASVFNTSGRTFADPYRGYNNGGIVALAEGGDVIRMANGTPPKMLTDEQLYQASGLSGQAGWEAAAKARDAQNAALTQYYSPIATDYVNTAVTNPKITASDFITGANTAGFGLTQPLTAALQGSGLSQSAQYALTHRLDDATGLGANPNQQTKTFYDTIGYTAGALPGDQGGLSGLYANINYSAKGLQDQINAGTLSVDDAKKLARGEMTRVGVNERDITNATGKSLDELFREKPITKVIDTFNLPTTPSGYYINDSGVLVPNISATQNTTTTVANPTDLYTAPATSLPVGVGGNTGPSQIGGGATVNPNGTITTSPRIPGIPVGGFTGMQNLRDVYTKGGGSLGFTSKTPTSLEDFDKTYGTGRLSGDSLAAYEYLTGKKGAKYPTKSGVGQISEDYATAVLGYPARGNLPYIYNKATGRMDVNPDYVAPGRDSAGNVTYSMSLNDIKSSLKETPLSGQALYDWAQSNNLSAQQIADATGRSLSSVYSDFRAGSKAAAKKKEDDKAAGINTLVESGGGSDDGDDGVGPGQGPGEGDGGGGATGGCVDPDVMVLLATGGSIRAGDLKVGDALHTLHEDTLKYGNFPVEFVEIINQPKLQVSFEDGQHIVVSTTHKFLMQTGDWKPMHDVAVGEAVTVGKGINQAGHKIITEIKSLAVGPVVKMTVTDAHTYIADGLVSHNKARGGRVAGYALGGLGTLGGYSDGGRLLKGPGDGVSDSIPATIGRKQQPARLADGEFVVPARIVSELGNGSTDAGAKKLYAMLDRVQRARGKTTGKNKVAANSRADKYLPA